MGDLHNFFKKDVERYPHSWYRTTFYSAVIGIFDPKRGSNRLWIFLNVFKIQISLFSIQLKKKSVEK